jgi:hypothetical protein
MNRRTLGGTRCGTAPGDGPQNLQSIPQTPVPRGTADGGMTRRGLASRTRLGSPGSRWYPPSTAGPQGVPIVPMRRYPRLSRLHPLSLSAMALLCGSVLLTAACGSKTPPATRPSPAPQPGAAAISSPPVAVPRPPAPPPLLGRVARADLKAYASWQPLFAQPPYVPDPAAIAAIKSNAKDVTVRSSWPPGARIVSVNCRATLPSWTRPASPIRP